MRYSSSLGILRRLIPDIVSLRSRRRESEASQCRNPNNRRLTDKSNSCLKKRSNTHTSLSRASTIRPRCCIQTSSATQGKNIARTKNELLPTTKGLGQEQGQPPEQADPQQDVEAEAPTMGKKEVNTSKSITILEFRAERKSRAISTSLSILLLSSAAGMGRSHSLMSLRKR